MKLFMRVFITALFVFILAGSLFGQGSRPVSQELFDYDGEYPEEGTIEYRFWITTRPDYVIEAPAPELDAYATFTELGRFVLTYNLGNLPAIGAPDDWSAGDIVRIEITHTPSGRIANREFEIPGGTDPIVFHNDLALTLADPPAVLFDSDVDEITTTAAMVDGYPEEGVYRAVDWDVGVNWQIAFSTVGVESDLLVTSMLRRQYDEDDFFIGPGRFRIFYSIDEGESWIQEGGNRLLPTSEDWFNIAFELPEACYGLENVMVKWEVYHAGDIDGNGWNEIRDVLVTAEVEEVEPEEGEMDYDDQEGQYTVTPPGTNLNIVFVPVAGQPQIVIIVEHSDDEENESVQLFPNPSALGAYFKFTFADAAVLGAGGELTLQFPNQPGQIWYRQGANWMPIPWDYIEFIAGTEYSYIIDLTALFGREGVRSGVIEFAGDNGIDTLPVELSSFTANVTANMFVELQWISETETNMLGYNVYRSSESSIKNADVINRNIIPANNSSSTTIYTFVDEDVYPGETYYYWLQNVDLDLTNSFHGPVAITVEEEAEIPEPEYVTALRRNYPNPFNPETTIRFSLREDTEMMELKVYNILGQLVRTLVPAGPHAKGDYEIVWDGTNDSGKGVTSGVYFYRMSTPNYNKIHKMMLMK